ncbi:unnamed protein product [Darwinula stevensoni]|uniref:Integrator complex subunit 12 n=1 Tax=Darwinula stevensoni TaxID=69355 RepID=A0A7R9FP57_9CRUS|nr:unnamed protein product [Darwinula stevensoni]CAG0897206.1 unnamed protein product [Darwinula stevensoni]
MANGDLDPVFVKALRLLFSQAKDSGIQLRAMVEEAVRQRQAGRSRPEEGIRSGSFSSSKVSVPSASAATYGLKYDSGKKESEKRSFEKLKEDLTEGSKDVLSKRPRLDSPKQGLSHSPSPSASSRDSDSPSKKSEDSESGDGLEIETMGMVMGLVCVVCKSLEVTTHNRLIECQECHQLYHQECHRPPVSDEDANDPRGIWYCAACGRNIKVTSSMKSKPQDARPSGSKPSFSANRLISTSGPSKLTPALSSSSSFLKATKSASPSKSSGLGGLSKPSPFANLSSVKTISSVSSKTLLAPKPGLPSSSNSLLTAEKRMQIMKKKAAAKLQGKPPRLK